MKIEKVNPVLIGEDKRLTNVSKDLKDKFSVFLEDAFKAQEGGNGIDMEEVSNSSVLQREITREEFPESSPVEDYTDGIKAELDKLEAFAGLLNSPDFSLRQIDEAADAVSREAVLGNDRGIGLGENDFLKNIEEEVRMLAVLESIKWRRGDYL